MAENTRTLHAILPQPIKRVTITQIPDSVFGKNQEISSHIHGASETTILTSSNHKWRHPIYYAALGIDVI